MKVPVRPKLFEDFKTFSLHQLHSRDIDPVYPVLKTVHQLRGLSRGDAAWHTLLYMTWYNLGSGETVWKSYPQQCKIDAEFILKTGVERRGIRGSNKGVEQLNWMYQNIGDLLEWVERHVALGGMVGWKSMYNAVQQIPGNGSWAAFKWCDLCKNVLGYDITSPDIGLGGGGKVVGPVPGLSRLTGRAPEICAVDFHLQKIFYLYCSQKCIPFDGLEELETSLCDFNSMVKGGYYVGHDIDKQMEDIAGLPNIYWDARRECFPREYLGELRGWVGVRKERKAIYMNTGEIVWA
jgi:hypothetical protein